MPDMREIDNANPLDYRCHCFTCGRPVLWADSSRDRSCPGCREARNPGRYLVIDPRGVRHLVNNSEEMSSIALGGSHIHHYEIIVGEVLVKFTEKEICVLTEKACKMSEIWNCILTGAKRRAEEIKRASHESD